MKKLSVKHKHGMTGSRLYCIWKGMRSRCYLKTNTSYHNYGGIGITMCKQWRDNPVSFMSWALANGYDDSLTIDREDPYGNYGPKNCRWVTMEIQRRNKRNVIGARSKYIGVYIINLKNGGISYVASIRLNRKTRHIATTHNERRAAKIRDQYVIENNLEGYRLNFPNR